LYSTISKHTIIDILRREPPVSYGYSITDIQQLFNPSLPVLPPENIPHNTILDPFTTGPQQEQSYIQEGPADRTLSEYPFLDASVVTTIVQQIQNSLTIKSHPQPESHNMPIDRMIKPLIVDHTHNYIIECPCINTRKATTNSLMITTPVRKNKREDTGETHILFSPHHTRTEAARAHNRTPSIDSTQVSIGSHGDDDVPLPDTPYSMGDHLLNQSNQIMMQTATSDPEPHIVRLNTLGTFGAAYPMTLLPRAGATT